MSKKSNPLKNIKKYFTQKEYFLIIIAILVSMLVSNGINLAAPQIASKYIDSYVSNTPFNTDIIYLLVALVVALAVFSLLQTFLSAVVGEKIAKDLRQRLFEKVLTQNYEYILKTKASKILTVIVSDVNFVKGIFIQAVISIITAVFLIVGSTILMFSINKQIAAVIIAIVPVIVILLILVLKNRFKLFTLAQKIRDTLNKVINENIKGSMLIRVFVSEKEEVSKFQIANTKSRDIGREIVKIFSIAMPAVIGINLLSTLVIIYLGGKQVIGGTFTLGELTAFTNYVTLFTMPMLLLGVMVSILGQAMASLRRINGVLDAPNKFKDGELEAGSFEDIKVKGLYYSIDKQEVLKNISFDIKKGEKIGIIGLTGSGKTTFLKQLIRSLEPNKGEILLNGKNLNQYQIKSFREKVGFTFQENFLVNDTILNNIVFGRNVSKEEALKAAQAADVEEFVTNMDQGYETCVGEEGSRLSGGQKQRVMIARALASNPQLLILDDVTSRLDATTEKKVFENIKTTYPEISIITVAQKISSVRDCDRIYIFDEGEITDVGNHKELLKTSALYKEIEISQKNYDS